MDTVNSVKCIAALFKVTKMIKCVKRVEIGVTVGVMILIGLSTALENKREIEKTVKKLKKRVI